MLTEAGWRELCSVRGVPAEDLQFFKATPQHWSTAQLSHVFEFKHFDKIFTIVRHPFDRMRSEYYWQLKQKLTNLAPAPWLDSVTDTVKLNPYAFDNHIRPQSEFIPSPTVKIFHLEDNGIQEAFQYVNPSIGVKLKNLFGTKNAHLKKRTPSPEIEAQFENLRERIESLYKEDIEAFGYDFKVKKAH